MSTVVENEKQQVMRLRFALSSFFFAHGMVFSSWASRIPSIKAFLDISEGQLGLLLLLMPLGQICTMPLAGKLVNRLGSKQIIQVGFLLYPLVLCIIGLTQSYTQLAICLFLFGVMGNFCNISINTQGIEVEAKAQKSLMSSFHGAWSISSFAGALLGLLLLSLGISTFIHFIMVYGIVLLVWFFNRNKLLDVRADVIQSKDSIFKQLDKTLLQLGVIGFLSMAIEGAMFDWSGVYFQNIVLAPEHLVIVGYTSFVLMMSIGRFLGDSLVRKFGRKSVIQCSGMLMSFGLILSVIFPQLWICTFAFMLVGLGGSCSIPTVFGAAGKHTKVSASIALTLVSTISFLGFLMGPPLIGFIAEISDLRYSYLLFSCFGFIMFFMAGRMSVFRK